jgi:ABC-2 type transport system ATP-binding protein
MASILAQSLTRHYGHQVAVDSLSFEISGGSVIGFLGPNGAGKSTTMRMLSTFLKPTSGTALINGFDIYQQAPMVQRQMGYLPEGAPLYSEMTVFEFLNFMARIRGLDDSSRRHSVGYVMERLYLDEVADQVIKTLSKGFGRRVGLAQAILHDPPILLLDEPTDGLDPIQKEQVRHLIQEMTSDRIVFISTHILGEVEALCQRIMIIADGKLVMDDSPAGVKAQSKYKGAITLNVDEPQRIASVLSDLKEVAHVEFRSGRLTAFPSGAGDLALAIQSLSTQQGWVIRDLHLESGRLEDVFVKAVSGELS